MRACIFDCSIVKLRMILETQPRANEGSPVPCRVAGSGGLFDPSEPLLTAGTGRASRVHGFVTHLWRGRNTHILATKKARRRASGSVRCGDRLAGPRHRDLWPSRASTRRRCCSVSGQLCGEIAVSALACCVDSTPLRSCSARGDGPAPSLAIGPQIAAGVSFEPGTGPE